MITSFLILYTSISTIYASVTYRPDQTTIITSKEGGWGSWSTFNYCNRGSYATAFYLRVEPKQDSGDDTSANGFWLICDDNTAIVAGNDAPWGNWLRADCNSNQAIKGFRTKVENSCGGNCDDTALNSIRAYCTDYSEILINSYGNWGTWGNIAQCPYGSIVCGFKQRVESEASCGGNCDDTALNAVQLACCSNSKSYSNGEGFWDPIYTGNSGVVFDQTITVGIEDYAEDSITQENSQSLESTLSASMSFSYMGVGGEISASLTSTVSSTVTTSSVRSVTTTKTEEISVSCNTDDGINYYGLYQFIVSAKEHGLNQNSYTFDVGTRDYWCSTVANQAPKCPPTYCNHSDNCQTCVGNIFS